MQLRINDKTIEAPELWHKDSLLQVLREVIGLTSPKLGCGAGLCGACTVLINGEPTRSCITPVTAAAGKDIQTLEGLASGGDLHPVQKKWLTASIPQCGYCQSGQIMATVALLRKTPQPTDEQIDQALTGHLCRCGTQARVRTAIREMSEAAR